MFTGIIEDQGIIQQIETRGSNRTFWVKSQISNELSIDQSLAHNGVCLTVESVAGGCHSVTAIAETLQKTNLGLWQVNDTINLERCITMNGRIDGHFVQGHVDCTAECIARTDRSGSWEFRFRIPEQFAGLIIEKGSIAINGISLTIFNVGNNEFSVAIIPYTFTHTTMNTIDVASIVNIEFDMVGKYITRNYQLQKL
ncbi:riboflavin synthase [Flavihumibacter fluvii]|uniref:riboflavin synthase n=1 Tax=Flavihumibacter fluvii TaxID=2838157 RepID=UPI001BDE1BE1|nr:riboflavin synthase [Flavihumibacter fluvii]ULQ54788.1 riboflavin synthase [Flavihumibacter fluvii]